MNRTTSWQDTLDGAIDAHADRISQVRRHLHAHPEPSGQEYQTTQYIADLITELDLSPQIIRSKRGLTVNYNAPADKQIGLRADIDALHINDTKSTDYASQSHNIMHACGHDAHTAMVYGAVLGLTCLTHAKALPTNISWRAIFQPAEETCVGALEMIDEGAVNDLSAIFGLHVDPTRPVGQIGLRKNVMTADCDKLFIDIHGRGGHASRPHESLDPIAAAAQLVNSIYLCVPRVVDTQHAVVVTISQIEGGESFNVIPDHCSMRGTMRSIGKEARAVAIDHIQKLSRALADATGTSINFHIEPGPPSVVNDPQLTDLVKSVAVDLLGETAVKRVSRPSMGGEDFANYLKHVPGCFFRLGTAGEKIGEYPLHSSKFDIDERALTLGAKLLARSVVQYFINHDSGNGANT